MSRAIAYPYGPPVAPARPATRQASRGWRVYLALATLLAPVCVPAGPGQTAALDFLNVSAIGLFALLALAPRRRLQLPMLVPMVVVAVGSLLAALNAPSMGLVTLAVAQDIYLFAWFVVVVNVVRGDSDLALVRRAWMWTAAIVAAIALVQLFMRYGTLATLLGSRGLRPSSTLYNPNMLADYLVISLFISASLVGHVRLLVRLPLMVIMALGLLSTKSNGGMAALASGSLVWVTVRALTSGVRLRTLAAGALAWPASGRGSTTSGASAMPNWRRSASTRSPAASSTAPRAGCASGTSSNAPTSVSRSESARATAAR
jgi:hypothetical protein